MVLTSYFQLQYKLINRSIKELGLNPIITYIIAITALIGFAIYLFSITEFAPYVLILTCIGLLSKLSQTQRNDFLKMVYTKKIYLTIRFIENTILSLPFILILLVKLSFFPVLIIVVLSIVMTLANFNTSFSVAIPTPFYKRPFEFIVGFRNTFYLFGLAYALTFIAIKVDNFNLGIFSLLLIFLISLTFYSKPENEYFVWSYNLKAKAFIYKKLKTSLIYSTILSLPILGVLIIHFQTNQVILIAFELVGYTYLITLVLIKYSAFPNKMSITQGIVVAISLYIPPLLLLIIPYYYIQSAERLKDLLE